MTALLFDSVIHPPARLRIMAVLAGVSEAEFALLRDTTEVSDSVLSKHLSALVDAGYVTLRKAAVNGRQRTWAMRTRAGAKAFKAHVAALTRMAQAADTADQASAGGAGSDR